jgi:hypothetical protein
MTVFTYMVEFGEMAYPAISVEANLHSRLRRSQNSVVLEGLPV